MGSAFSTKGRGIISIIIIIFGNNNNHHRRAWGIGYLGYGFWVLGGRLAWEIPFFMMDGLGPGGI
jgi:hypothetical protein